MKMWKDAGEENGRKGSSMTENNGVRRWIFLVAKVKRMGE